MKPLLVCYNLYPFRSKNGRVFQWISSPGCPRRKVKIVFTIYVVVDRLTTFAHFFVISATYTTMQVAELFFKEIFKLHGLCKQIVNDRDNRFMSSFWQELFKLNGMNLTPSTNYNPQTERKTDIVNKWLEDYLRNYVSRQQQAWVKWLHVGQYCYNSIYHLSIKMSPFMALYRYEAPTLVDIIFDDSRIPKAKEFLQDTQDIMRSLKENIRGAQDWQKKYANQKGTEHAFEEGDMVYLRIQPYRQSTLKQKGSES